VDHWQLVTLKTRPILTGFGDARLHRQISRLSVTVSTEKNPKEGINSLQTRPHPLTLHPLSSSAPELILTRVNDCSITDVPQESNLPLLRVLPNPKRNSPPQFYHPPSALYTCLPW
jgi:hypothetical protein